MANKSLGQHWLFDVASLSAMCESADIKPGESVLEVGPGLGTLTHELLIRGANVVAVELDHKLIPDLKDRFRHNNFELHVESILTFDLRKLPKNYKVCANIPYYLTSHLLRILCESSNRPRKAALLVQKEVAERVTADPGELSLLAVSVQVYAQATLGKLVPAGLFSPPPKVDSQILILDFYEKPLVNETDMFFKVVKAGFSSPRKKLRSSLAAGLRISVKDAEHLLNQAEISPDRRAQTVSIDEWKKLVEQYVAYL